MSRPTTIPSRARDMTGFRVGGLVAVNPIGLNAAGKQMWLCRCDCGVMIERSGRNLHQAAKRQEHSSCGCIRRRETDGLPEELRLNRIWHAMRRRCSKPSYSDYHIYGGRGIVVCARWQTNFTAFYEWAMAHGYEDGLSIERVDVNGNYEPGNCTWIPLCEQYKNRRDTLTYTFQGKTQGIRAWADELGISFYALKARLYYHNWPVERALTTPVNKNLARP